MTTTAHAVEVEIGGRTLRFETGKLAKQANGAVVVSCGDTVILATAVHGPARVGADFFPLTVDYREKTYAAGKIPGGFFKREARPTNKEILTMRMIDRPTRPLFPPGYRDEVQIQTMVLSADPELDPDIAAMNGASAAMALSDIPYLGPTGAVRIGRVDGKLIINPTHAELEYGDLDMIVAGHKDGVNMIEAGALEVAEDVIAEAVALGFDAVKKICQAIEDLRAQCGKEKMPYESRDLSELVGKIRDFAWDRMSEAKSIGVKQDRGEAMQALRKDVLETFAPADVEEPEYTSEEVSTALHDVEEEVVRDFLLTKGKRPDGRGLKEVRQLTSEVGVLPRTHGSAIFTRGETQALVVTTLGTVGDEQIVDGLTEEYSKKFMLHYNFPPFCVGEARRLGATSRREIGHGALAERALAAVLPAPEEFPYTIRVVSDILESNGSSSMASVCGGTLSLMDAGVPICRPVAGISVGMVSKGDRRVLLTDIMGDEDHFGDMDFKVAGTQRGVTAIQVDLKVKAIDEAVIGEALAQAKEARRHILQNMLSELAGPRDDISMYAPRIVTIQINPEKIGKVIGPGGKDIKRIQETTQTKIDIDDDGTVTIAGAEGDGALRAREMIAAMTEDVEVGRVYQGKVVSIRDFGAFVEITPGQDGLCHISELSNEYIDSVTDVVNVGDALAVKVIAVDDQGRVKLSARAVDSDSDDAKR